MTAAAKSRLNVITTEQKKLLFGLAGVPLSAHFTGPLTDLELLLLEHTLAERILPSSPFRR